MRRRRSSRYGGDEFAIVCADTTSTPLDQHERTIMERHPLVGEQILAPVEFLAGVATLVRHAHERWDGTGYPDGLSGEAIPLGSRIILACDAHCAMLNDRPHRPARSEAEALEELRTGAGTQFDLRVVEALLAVLVPEELRNKTVT